MSGISLRMALSFGRQSRVSLFFWNLLMLFSSFFLVQIKTSYFIQIFMFYVNWDQFVFSFVNCFLAWVRTPIVGRLIWVDNPLDGWTFKKRLFVAKRLSRSLNQYCCGRINKMEIWWTLKDHDRSTRQSLIGTNCFFIVNILRLTSKWFVAFREKFTSL